MTSIYGLVFDPVFQVLAVYWLVVLIVWRRPRAELLSRAGRVLGKPGIFTPAPRPDPDGLPTYPRRLLEDTAVGLRDGAGTLLSGIITRFESMLATWRSSNKLFEPDHPMRTISLIFLWPSFLVLVYSDAVRLATVFFEAHVIPIVPAWLLNYALAIFGGALTCLIIGFAYLVETVSNPSELTNMSERSDSTRGFYHYVSIIICGISFVTLVTLGLQALSGISGTLAFDAVFSFVTNVLIPLNSGITAVLIFREFLAGCALILLLAGQFTRFILEAVNWILVKAAPLLGYAVDIVVRLGHIVVDFLLWFGATPVQALAEPFRMLARYRRSRQPSPTGLRGPTSTKASGGR